jgi:hypothetical protein
MLVALARRPLLSGFLLLAAIWFVLAWFFSGPDKATAPYGRAGVGRSEAGRSAAKGSVGSPRSLQGLTLADRPDISADARPPDTRRQNISREFFETVQELKFMHPQVFDGAAQRWAEDPKVKAIRAEWKEIEAGWMTQEESAKAAQLPRMQAMWKEATGLLRAEVDKSAREAAVK